MSDSLKSVFLSPLSRQTNFPRKGIFCNKINLYIMAKEIRVAPDKAICGNHCIQGFDAQEEPIPWHFQDGDRALLIGDENGFELYHWTNDVIGLPGEKTPDFLKLVS